jgi:hypothetical protein
MTTITSNDTAVQTPDEVAFDEAQVAAASLLLSTEDLRLRARLTVFLSGF